MALRSGLTVGAGPLESINKDPSDPILQSSGKTRGGEHERAPSMGQKMPQFARKLGLQTDVAQPLRPQAATLHRVRAGSRMPSLAVPNRCNGALKAQGGGCAEPRGRRRFAMELARVLGHALSIGQSQQLGPNSRRVAQNKENEEG